MLKEGREMNLRMNNNASQPLGTLDCTQVPQISAVGVAAPQEIEQSKYLYQNHLNEGWSEELPPTLHQKDACDRATMGHSVLFGPLRPMMETLVEHYKAILQLIPPMRMIQALVKAISGIFSCN